MDVGRSITISAKMPVANGMKDGGHVTFVFFPSTRSSSPGSRLSRTRSASASSFDGSVVEVEVIVPPGTVYGPRGGYLPPLGCDPTNRVTARHGIRLGHAL